MILIAGLTYGSGPLRCRNRAIRQSAARIIHTIRFTSAWGAASLGNVCIGVYGLWHSAAFGEDFANVSGDLGLVVSNDGIHFREPGVTPGQPFIHRDDSPATAVPGRTFNTILCQGNGILNVGDETRIYHGRWRNVGQKAEDMTEYRGEVALATLPRDRWGALGLNANEKWGTLCSAPITLPDTGGELSLNADGVAGLTVDLLDERFNPIPGFIGGVVNGPDGLDCPVCWQGHAPAVLAGQSVRIRVNLQQQAENLPRVYALYVRADHQ